MSHDGGENLYLKAIHHPERTEQLRAFLQFTEDEMDRVWRQLQDLEHDDGSIPDENRELWSQRKGELDAHRLFHGMFTQALLTAQGGLDALHGHGDIDTPDETDIRCHACGATIDHIEEPEDVGHPVCPECGGNPLPPVGGSRLPDDPAPDDDTDE